MHLVQRLMMFFVLLFLVSCSRQVEETPEPESFPEYESVEQHQVDEVFSEHLEILITKYTAITEAMYQSNHARIMSAVRDFKHVLGQPVSETLQRSAQAEWRNLVIMLTEESDNMLESQERIALEAYFYALSDILTTAIERYGAPITVYRFYCQQAFEGSGAAWLDLSQDVRNPYRSQNLGNCGIVEATY